ncbi:hypothetical protein C4D60_Mb11t12630 [Musa balbisiana]|uniref:C3H1-type domain-containing protein n=1 Tax=Musa balbisiana TaxID=52838 RepID=A0A4S8J3L8_MUSBA|nr:hypothetical protein C4D60_Mb11t12630 [Musa balbisiana]
MGILFAGHPIIVDFSLVMDFHEVTCRQHKDNACNRGGFCNFIHLKQISWSRSNRLDSPISYGDYGVVA